MRTLRVLASLTLVLAGVVPALIVACSSDSNDLLGGNKPGGGDGGFASDADASGFVGNEDAPSEFVPDADFDAFIPLNSVDAADIPDGGAKVTPGIIKCGGGGNTCNAFAGDQCCTDDEGGACFTSLIACPTGGGAISCNESADCIVGDVCCGSVNLRDAGADGGDPAPPYVDSHCSASCKTTLLQLCRTNGECGDAGPCVIQSCPDGRTYELCGVFSMPTEDGGPTFACTPL